MLDNLDNLSTSHSLDFCQTKPVDNKMHLNMTSKIGEQAIAKCIQDSFTCVSSKTLKQLIT